MILEFTNEVLAHKLYLRKTQEVSKMKSQTTQVTQIYGVSESNQTDAKRNKHNNPPTVEEIQEWLISYLVELLPIEKDEVDVTTPFERYGLDSSAAVTLTGDLGDWLGRNLDPTLLYDYPTIETLAQHLVEETK
jgi:acyl carrier protein